MKIKQIVIVALMLLVFPWPAQAISTKIETVQDAATANGNGTASDIKGMTTAVIQVSDTFSATVNFEVSIDGTNFDAVQCSSVSDRTVFATTATATGSWRCNVVGISRFRTRVSGYNSGSVTVKIMFISAGVF